MSDELKCRSCSNPAEFIVHKWFRIIPADDRLFCTPCLKEAERREDLILVAGLLFMLITFVLAIWADMRKANAPVSSSAKAKMMGSGAIDPKDLDQDGRVDYFEETATLDMRDRAKKNGYPWQVMEGRDSQGKPFRFKFQPAQFKELYERQENRGIFNFPLLMDKYLSNITSPNSKVQLFKVYLTQDKEIAFIVRELSIAPADIKPVEETKSKGKYKYKSKSDPNAEIDPYEKYVRDAYIGYEKLEPDEYDILVKAAHELGLKDQITQNGSKKKETGKK